MEAIFAVGAASVAVRILAGRSALVSFAKIGTNFCPTKSVEKLLKVCPRVVLDSGAFSAWTLGTPIDLSKYIDHVREHGGRFAWCAALDAIGDGPQSVTNWHAMRASLPELASKIVPVFHEGEPLELLDEYTAAGGLVGLGRTEGRLSKPKTFAFYDACFNRAPGAKFHAFGNGSPETLEVYPFASFDCTTWERDSSYGGSHGWPWSSASKNTRMTAYVEALSTIRHRAGNRPLDLLAWGEARAANESEAMQEECSR